MRVSQSQVCVGGPLRWFLPHHTIGMPDTTQNFTSLPSTFMGRVSRSRQIYFGWSIATHCRREFDSGMYLPSMNLSRGDSEHPVVDCAGAIH